MSARKSQKQKSGGALFNSISAIIICAALVLGVSVFFRVSNIEVSGASRYSAEAVIEASGVKDGANLVFLNRAAIEARISDTLVYAGRVKVSRKLPNTVLIEIQESGTVACVETEDGLWLIDNFCRLLEEAPAGMADSYINVTGFTALAPKAGNRLSVPDEDKSKVDYLEDILNALQSVDMLRDVSSVDMSTSGNPQFVYVDRFRVKLGRNDSLDAKLALLRSAVGELGAEERGVFDLSEPQQAHFSPE